MSELSLLIEEGLKNPEVKAEYDALESEFNLINTLLDMRTKAGLTQAGVALRMATQKNNVSRLEAGKGNPTIKTLGNYAKACGCKLDIAYHTI
jgi:DNA-binding XRE family transcriptional regulator